MKGSANRSFHLFGLLDLYQKRIEEIQTRVLEKPQEEVAVTRRGGRMG